MVSNAPTRLVLRAFGWSGLMLFFTFFHFMFQAFVIKFTEGLSQEYSNKGIILQCVTPGYVATNMSKFRNTSFLVPSSESFVKTALSIINTDWLTDGYFSHTLMHSTLNFLKSISSSFVIKKTLKSLETSRNKILKRSPKKEKDNWLTSSEIF